LVCGPLSTSEANRRAEHQDIINKPN